MMISIKRVLSGLLICLVTFSYVNGQEYDRTETTIDFNWRFHLGDIDNGQQLNLPTDNWRKLDVPHDWSIEGDYSQDNPGGGKNAFLPGGIGWYRKDLLWEKEWKGKQVSIIFDGVYMNSKVWINGHFLGYRPYGYSSFQYDLTPYLRKENNVIAVRVDNSKQPSGRWYTGSGIYRHVHLLVTNKLHIAFQGTYVTTPVVSASNAEVNVVADLINDSDRSTKNIVVLSAIYKDGNLITSIKEPVDLSGDSTKVTHKLQVKNPHLWKPSSPEMYELKTIILTDKDTLDQYTTPVGIRQPEYSAENGFTLNGKPLFFKGVCIHQGAGPVGIAVPEDVWHRRLKILKDMGVNAIRTTHHPFAPEFYAMCDTLGIMVMDEAFDGWYHWEDFQKAKWDYGHSFLEWWQRDLEDFIRRDRNHPSVMIWSMGNEVWDFENHLDLQEDLYAVFKKLDPSRPVTQGWATGKFIDIAGFNANGEGKHDLIEFHKKHPDMVAIGTEIPHTRQTRGVYRTQTSYNPWDQPDKSGSVVSAADKENIYPIANLSDEEVFTGIDPRYASGYDNQTRKISVRDAWKQVRDYSFYIGDFRWTGFDYLGEAWSWPARTNNYGVIDLAGFPKDNFYLYQSLWKDTPMVYILPHWNHPGKEGQMIPVVAYTNGEEVELLLNGRSLGRKPYSKDSLQIVWQVPYEPGVLIAKAYKGNKLIAIDEKRTAGPPARIQMNADKTAVRANRRDVIHIEINITDDENNFVPIANDSISFKISGPYKLLGVENGDILDMSPPKVTWRNAFMGKVLLMLQTTAQAGNIDVTALANGLKPDSISITVRNP